MENQEVDMMVERMTDLSNEKTCWEDLFNFCNSNRIQARQMLAIIDAIAESNGERSLAEIERVISDSRRERISLIMKILVASIDDWRDMPHSEQRVSQLSILMDLRIKLARGDLSLTSQVQQKNLLYAIESSGDIRSAVRNATPAPTLP